MTTKYRFEATDYIKKGYLYFIYATEEVHKEKLTSSWMEQNLHQYMHQSSSKDSPCWHGPSYMVTLADGDAKLGSIYALKSKKDMDKILETFPECEEVDIINLERR